MGIAHQPVLLAEALELLAVRPGGRYVDGTVGLGGHAEAILRHSSPNGTVLGVDRDSEALEEAGKRLAPFAERASLVHANYREIPRLLGEQKADGILLDLGVSSLQLEAADRGFSFRAEGPLDMRMDRSHGPTAEELVNRLPEAELADIIFRYGEERASRRIARAIVEARRRHRITTTSQLATLVRGAAGRSRRPGLDPATRTFQALRIQVNHELEGLADCLERLAGCLAQGGRLAVIAFHSLEDREVKQRFRGLAGRGFALLTRKPLAPGEAELARNPRARSAHLRALVREAA